MEKAQRLKEQAQGRGDAKGDRKATLAITKLTTRLPTEQVEWLREQAKGYRERNPRRPRVTIEELIAIAVEHLREAKNLDATIAKYRS